ncbi:hypothetical protein BDP27DRAFT_1452568 [Rhodocollybia butyracea]|uniref:Uncharacterized protein n=1 Tax=Rhodocollybia butyracea TaxID=206335 RepID=A0A9P5P9F4_9AGAR|nr:hypothetical protein BDP27DRAFT_1452568 [Rhodocollybia butyracea]
MSRTSQRDTSEQNKRECSICHKHFDTRGIARHQISCQQKLDDAKSAKAFRSKHRHTETSTIPPSANHNVLDNDSFLEPEQDISLETNTFESDPQHDDQEFEDEIQHDDIKVEYHPHSGRKSSIQHFEDFEFKKNGSEEAHPPLSSAPWHPWRSRMDFEVASLALESHMNEKQTNKLIDLLNCAARGHDAFTLKNYAEMQSTWDLSAERLTKFQKEEILELLLNQDIVSQMEWDAQRLSKFDSESQTWKQFIKEAWSANAWWEIQSKLPVGAVPLCIVFYADKSKLSSFGTEKGYPVIVRCANLPMDIRNGAGIAGGRVVGWLPVVVEEAEHSGKADWANFKNAVWHEATGKIFESISGYSKTGYTITCGDNVKRNMFPCILIKSSDFEEQCVVCLTRGLRGLCSCVRCLIPKGDLMNFETEYTMRTAQQTIDVLNDARQKVSKGEEEEVLKKFGLRSILNTFFKLANSDPYASISFDDLHFFVGIWDHLFEEAKLQFSERNQMTEIDHQFKHFPRWRNLHHFGTGVMKNSFNDGSKHHDISKLFLFGAHNVVPETKNKAGYTLLKVMRKYINVIMYAGLDVHTTDTMILGRDSITSFVKTLKIYISQTADREKPKSWNSIIKLHYLRHLYDDIESKGVLRGMSTKPNEKFHGPLRKIYLRRTNFKDTAQQIVRIEHQNVVAAHIWDEIQNLDAFQKGDPDVPDDIEAVLDNIHFTLGSKCKPLSFGELEGRDVIFSRLHLRAGEFLSGILTTFNSQIQIKYTHHDIIILYQFLKVRYESLDTWRLATDYLRCNPHFRGEARFDFVIFKGIVDPVFAQMHYIFVCKARDQEYPLALVQSYKVVHARPRIDKDLGILRIRKGTQTELIPVSSIIRGAVVLPLASDNLAEANDMLVFDALDADMFLRIKNYYPGYTDGR